MLNGPRFELLILAAWLVVAAECAGAAVTRVDYAELIENPRHLAAAERLKRFFDIDWQRSLDADPELATSLGHPGFEHQWTDRSLAAIERYKREAQWQLAVLKSIDRAQLEPDDQLNYDLFRRAVEEGIEGQQFPGDLLVLNQLGGIQNAVPAALEDLPRLTVRQYEHILGRLRGVPQLIDQNLERLERGVATGVMPPRVTMREVPRQTLSVLTDNPLDSPLLKVFADFPASIPTAEQARLRTQAVKIYTMLLVPAYYKLYDYLTRVYIPKARDTIALSALPNGRKWYAYCVRGTTTTSMTPEQIHQLGLSEVRRIRSEMDALIAATSFKGSFQDFTHYLSTDPRFFYQDAGELIAGFRDIAKRIDPELPKLFGRLPRLTYGVQAVPAYAEESVPAAYYSGGSLEAGRPGWLFANTSHLQSSRPKWQMEPLVLHEAVPGHHLQISLARELATGPEFRKYASYAAYTEGWALYAESLGAALGLYKDPYARFGALAFEIWRAARLVVDTGIHELNWSRAQAIDYMKAQTGKDEHEVTVEIDRYIVLPSQALAYKVGQLKIRELKEFAQRELGASFDLRAFHDAVLENGSLPLDILEQRIRMWVQFEKT